MALSSTKLDTAPDFKVLVQNRAGEFLAGGPDKWFFTHDRLRAIVFHYEADHVAEQLETLRVKYSIALEAVPIPLEELRYWSVERQEAYAGPRAVLQRLFPSRID